MISKIIKFILSLCMMIGLLSPIPSYAVEEEEVDSTQNDAFVIGEDETRRTESSKTFIMSDDSYQQVIYGVPVHYENDNGEYENIDNTLIAASDSEEEFETAQSDMKIRFSKKMHKSNLARIDYGDYRITWGLKDMERRSDAVIESHDSHSDDIRLNALDNISGSVRYDDVMDHVSLRYGFDSLRVKEDIILEQYVSDSTFTFTYRTDNMKLEKNSDGEIEARDIETDEVIFIMPRPYMYDASYRTSYDVDYAITGSNGHYEITVSADNEWLNDESRVYPVIIDPIIETDKKRAAIDTTFITSWQGTTNHSTKKELVVGTETSEYGYCRTLLKFALPELNRGDMVTGAELNISSYSSDFHSSGTADMQVNAHVITSPWNITNVTWNTKPSHEVNTVLDYDYVRSDDEAGLDNWKAFDITRAVKNWYEGTSDNNGIMLKSSVESSEYSKYAVKSNLYSERREDSSYYPYIIITYSNTKGLELYYDYTSAGASNGDEVHINTYNGNPVVVRTDLCAPAGKNPASLGHVYNGYMLDVNVGDIRPWAGTGWRLDVQQTIRSTDENIRDIYPYVYTDGDGTEHYFMETADGYIDEDGLGLTLLETSTGYTLKSATKSNFTFNSLGNLTKMTDEYGNDITVTYKSDNKTISTISDETGYVITLESYETGTEAGYLKKASDNKGNTSTFYYSQKRLISIISSDNRENASYTYDDNGNLVKISCKDGSSLGMEYTEFKTNYRVKKITEYGMSGGEGQSILFDRTKYLLTDVRTSGKDCTISTADDVITQCQFDSSGRLVTCHAKTNGNELGAYSQKLSSSSPKEDGSDIKKLNRYERMGNLNPTVDNMLKNHSGDTTSGWGHSSSVGNSTFAFSSDNYRSLFGTHSFKLSSSQCDELGRARFYQNITSPYIQPNTTYTASAYIRTVGVNEVANQSNGGAAILIYMKAASLPTDSDPEAADTVSEYVVGTTDEKVNDGWRRVSVTFTTPSDIEYVRFNGIIRGATGTAYFDGLQLEKGSTPSPYNMIENGGMERVSNSMPEGWSSQLLTSSDKAVTTSYRYGSNSFSLTPDASKKKELYQEVSVKGSKEDTYVLSGWSKGYGILESDDSRKYKISVQVIYNDNTHVWKTPAEFTYAVGDWKYAATSFNLSDGTDTEKTPAKIRVCLRSHGQANTVYYDGIQLTRKNVDICSYDESGNLKKSGKESYTYENNLIKTSKDSTGKETTYTYYNGTSKILKISDNRSSAITTYAYDGFGNIIAEAYKKSDNSMSIKTETVYDSTGSFVTSTKDENGYSTTSQYDMERGLLTSYTDAKGTVTEYGYDSLDRLTSVTEGDMGHVISYNSKNLLSSIDTGNTDYSFEYDQFGNMTGVSIGNQRISSNTYAENNGDLTSYSLNNGMSYSYEYDSRGELIKVKRGNSLVQHIVYDREGTLLESRNYSSGLVTRYRYDFDGNVVGTDVYALQADGIADRWKYGVETGYDEHERVIRNSVKTHGTSYNSDITYDSSGKVATSTSGGKTITYSYDDINRPIKRSLDIGTGVDITYAYKDSARGAGYTTNQLAAERIDGVRYEYAYDLNGNITSINRTNSSNNGKVIYTYDSHDQLIREDNPISGTSTSYAYDANGNVTSKTVKNYANGTIGSQISSVSYNCGSTVSGDRLTKIGNEAITYDSIGNPLNMDGWTLSWSGRRLTSMTKGNDTISFGYDAEGRRISKTVNGAKTRYFYIGDTAAGEESAANGKIAYIYDDAGRISALRRTINGTTTTYHLLTNSRGDVEAIYLSDGTLIARYIYDAYGNEIMKEYGSTEAHRGMANINPFRYRGYMYDRETGYYYLMSRYYNPTIGRFISAEPNVDNGMFDDGAGIIMYNLYAYCANNPIILKDENGESITVTCVCIFGLAGMLLGAGHGAISSYKKTGKVSMKSTLYWAFVGGLIGCAVGYGVGVAIGTSGLYVSGSGGKALLKSIQNTKIYNKKFSRWIQECFRYQGKIGNGGLSDAIRYELRYNKLVRGKSHIKKGLERVNGLKKIIKSGELTPSELTLAKKLLSDLERALGGK